MRFSYDPEKRRLTLENRMLDFDDAANVFAGIHFTASDARHDYGEDRKVTVGSLDGNVVVLVWTERGDSRRIISMRKAERDEREEYYRYLE